MIPDDQLNALKDRNPVNEVAAQWVRLRRQRRGKYTHVGPCPICSVKDMQSKTATRFECNDDHWICAVCHDKGDVIKLLAKREGLDFIGAIERLGGVRDEVPTPDLARKAGLRDYQRAEIKSGSAPRVPYDAADQLPLYRAYCEGWALGARRDATAAQFRARELEFLRGFVVASAPIAGTPVESYLSGRGLIAPRNARLRYHPSMPLFCDGVCRCVGKCRCRPILAHRGPAMLAPFYNADGVGIGLHITWLDPAGPKGKALVCNPETGEVLPSKKMRGTKAGGYIDLGGCDGVATRMIAGEGSETVLAVYTALVRAGRAVERLIFRAAGDLGNLAGRALTTLAHPTLKTETGRPQRVPGPDPDLDSPAMPVPDTVPELILLGDGDSDPFLTRNALERASHRYARDGRSIRVRFGADGLDFNDMTQGKNNDDD